MRLLCRANGLFMFDVERPSGGPHEEGRLRGDGGLLWNDLAQGPPKRGAHAAGISRLMCDPAPGCMWSDRGNNKKTAETKACFHRLMDRKACRLPVAGFDDGRLMKQ